MIIYLFIFILAIIPIGLQFYITKNYAMPASDKVYHKLLINLIKINNNKPILRHKNIINSHLQSYPQLLHLLLSNFSEKTINRFDKNIPIFMLLLNLAAFFFFLFSFVTYFNFHVDLKFYLLSTFFFVTNPYHYNIANAKNVGLSARGFGLFLGITVSIFMLLFLQTHNLYFYIFGAIFGFLILLSSQFSTQFFYFVYLVFYLITLRYEVVLLPVISTSLFFIFFPKLAYVSLKGQLNHKKLYYKYLSEKFILLHRISIWRDIFYDIPRTCFHRLLKENWNFYRAFKILFASSYIRRNSLVILIIEFPLLLAVLFYGFHSDIFEFKYIWYFIWSCFIVFFATTFRLTRFLGEPERYMEYSLPFVAIIGAIILPSYMQILICFFSVFVIFISLPPNQLQKTSTDIIHSPDIDSIKKYLLENQDTARLISVTVEDTKFLLDPRINCYYFIVYNEKVDGFHFLDVYPEKYGFLGDKIVDKLINFYSLNYLLINKNVQEQYSIDYISSNVNGTMSVAMENDTYVLWKIKKSDNQE